MTAKKNRTITRALRATAPWALLCAYAVLTVQNRAVLVGLLLIVALAAWICWRRNVKPFGVWYGTTTALVTLVLVDAMLFMLTPVLFSYNDIPGMPDHRAVVNRDGYRTAAMEENFHSSVETEGQAAAFLTNAGQSDATVRRTIVTQTDQFGLRNAHVDFFAPQDVIVIGDSFVYGYATDQKDLWSTKLAADAGIRVYNAGVYGIGPSQEVELLYYLAEQGLGITSSTQVVWYFFEGNDASDTNAYKIRYPHPLLGQMGAWIGTFRSRAFLNQATRIVQYAWITRNDAADYDVFYSDRFGPMAFKHAYVAFVTETDETDIQSRMETNGIPRAFERLAALQRQIGFQVLVMYGPTKSRVYANAYPDHPPLEQVQPFQRAIMGLAVAHGFDALDVGALMHREMMISARLLFWPDDTHLNTDGHAFLAEVIARLRNGTAHVRQTCTS